MCRPHWTQYTGALRKAALARKAANQVALEPRPAPAAYDDADLDAIIAPAKPAKPAAPAKRATTSRKPRAPKITAPAVAETVLAAASIGGGHRDLDATPHIATPNADAPGACLECGEWLDDPIHVLHLSIEGEGKPAAE